LTRIYAVLSGINSAIVRIRERDELLNETCRIAVEHGKFAMAWIGQYDTQSSELTPVASAGDQGVADLLNDRMMLRGEVAQATGLTAQMFRERRPVYCNDLTGAPDDGGERRAEAIRRGYRSM